MKNPKSCWRLLARIFAGLFIVASNVSPVSATEVPAQLFARLPANATGPEGIAIGPDDNVYVSTFGFNTTGQVAGPGKIYVFSRAGALLRTLSVTGSTAGLLGLAFHPTNHRLLVVDNGGSKVYRVDPITGAATVFMTVTGSAGLNAITFDAAGRVYVSDSYQGIIWRIGAGGGAATAWLTNDLLKTTGVPPFGANGLAFNSTHKKLFVANTGNDQIIQVPIAAYGTAGTPSVFVNSINGADGLIIDSDDNIWVAANQADQIVVMDKTGKLIARLGAFSGVASNGVPRGLLFPASLVFADAGGEGINREIYVTNLALDLRLFGLAQSPDSQWAGMVKFYTVSKISARPNLP
jgi:sugar lactone lactonase YvrE